MTSDLATLLESSDGHGGKAKGLRKLGEAGFPTPDGLALSVEAIGGLLDGNEGLRTQLGTWLDRTGEPVAIRSSAIAEDGQMMSYAGMFESKLGVAPALANVLDAINEVSASGSSERVASYSGDSVPRIPVVVQRMVEPLLSGVSFTRAIGTDGESVLYSEWVEGLGDKLVSGQVTPSRIIVPWNSDLTGLERSAVSSFGQIPPAGALEQLLDAVVRLGQAYDGNWDIEWSVDREGELWMLQMRPVTRTVLVPSMASVTSPLAASPGTASGPAFLVEDEDSSGLQDGEVLIAELTDIDYVPAMKRSSAIVTEHGGMLSHAAIVARELGKPCVVGVTGALSLLQAGEETTVDGTSGSIRQSGVALGSSGSQEIDWRSLTFYDRGLEITCLDHPLYLESLPTGLVAYTSEEIDSSEIAEIEGELRRNFKRPVSLAVDQKQLWFLEWRRFYQLSTVTYFEAMLKTALARWDAAELTRVLDLLKKIAARVGGEEPTGKTHELYLRELGAALHSLCWIAVEGIGAWTSYRDTLLWRQTEGISYNEFLAMRPTDKRATSEVARMLECLEVLSVFRNESYEYFVSVGAFTDDYFETREQLVEDVCQEQGLQFVEGGGSLEKLYGLVMFRDHDCAWLQRVIDQSP